mmetsp:Transcript_5876/g.9399  ORF Transcript_5876/g.9399 Transcript_5876/m.9399 type:complete len:517 (-) Transcript_5876:74-1624(-)
MMATASYLSLTRAHSDRYTTIKKKLTKSHKLDTILKWQTLPTNVLIVKKIRDIECTGDFIDVGHWLLFEFTKNLNEKLNIFVQSATFEELRLIKDGTHPQQQQISSERQKKTQAMLSVSGPEEQHLHAQTEEQIGDDIHLMVVLGGDGTLLHLISLFTGRKHVPPICCFQRGSLGFLAPFQFSDYQSILSNILSADAELEIAVRMRLTARVWRHPDNVSTPSSPPALTSPLLQSRSVSSEASAALTSPKLAQVTEVSEMTQMETVLPIDTVKLSANKVQMHMPAAPPLGRTTSEPTRGLFGKKVNHDICSGYHDDETKEDNYLIRPRFDPDDSAMKTQTKFPGHVCTGTDSMRHALNEVLVHRDNNASMMQARLYIDCAECTVIQADGMIFSTPTGSTAYNISAGGSLISPTVPCIALTPICPHTLSFRPVVVSDETMVHIEIPKNARYDAVVSFDGKNQIELKKGDVVEILKCPYPVPTFKSSKFNIEWFKALGDKFNWNQREVQKPFEPQTPNQ